MTQDVPVFDIYAIKYATRPAQRRTNFIDGDPHDGPMPLDYFVWVAVGSTGVYVIDTGFTAEIAKKRERTFLRCPIESLGLIGVKQEDVKDVIITHLHNDHAGNLERFTNARFHLQEKEIHFATGRYMRYPNLSRPFEVEDVCDVVRLNFRQRMVLHTGAAEIAPGIRIHPVGGHSHGLQFVSVHTARGWVAVASDVSHFYENMEQGRPFRLAFHVGEMMDGFEALYASAESRDHVIPGHDPLVMERYAPPRPELEGIVVTVSEPPRVTSA